MQKSALTIDFNWLRLFLFVKNSITTNVVFTKYVIIKIIN